MPVRPRHCNGHRTRARHATDFGREGERRGPEPGDDSSSAPRTHALGGGAGGDSRAAHRAAHCPGILPRGGCPSCIAGRGSRLSRSRRRLAALAPRRDRALSNAGIAATRKPRVGRGVPTIRDDFGDTLALRRAAAPHRLAQPGDDRAVLRARRRRPPRRPHALRSLPDRRAAVPTSATACSLTSRQCSARVRTSSCCTPATTTATRRRDCRAAGVPTFTLRVDRIAEFRRAVTMVLGTRASATPPRAHAVVDSVDRTLERVRAATQGAAGPRRS